MKLMYLHPGKESDRDLFSKWFRRVEEIIKEVVRPDTTFEIGFLPEGLPYLKEGMYWYAQPRLYGEMVAVAKKAEKDGFDAVVIGCVGSTPAEYGAKEALDIPVVGIGESAFLLAQILGQNFALLTYNRKVAAWLDKVIREHHLEDICVSIRSADVEWHDFIEGGTGFYQRILEQAKKAIDEDRTDVIIPASGGFAGLAQYLRKYVKAYVVDPIEAGVKFAEVLSDLKKATDLYQSRGPCFQSSPNTEKVLKSIYPKVNL